MSKPPDSEAMPAASSVSPENDDFPVIPSGASGKLYDWELEAGERPPLIAMSAQSMAERADAEDVAQLQAAIQRTAALLLVVSRNNQYEGRDPAVIMDDLTCGTVADLLSIDIDMLARALLSLNASGLVAATETGNLRIHDIDGLDRVAEAA